MQLSRCCVAFAPTAPPAVRRSAVVKATDEKMMWEALKDAIDEEMEDDPTVCLMGKPSLHVV